MMLNAFIVNKNVFGSGISTKLTFGNPSVLGGEGYLCTPLIERATEPNMEHKIPVATSEAFGPPNEDTPEKDHEMVRNPKELGEHISTGMFSVNIIFNIGSQHYLIISIIAQVSATDLIQKSPNVNEQVRRLKRERPSDAQDDLRENIKVGRKNYDRPRATPVKSLDTKTNF
jgi:hypothetical protein